MSPVISSLEPGVVVPTPTFPFNASTKSVVPFAEKYLLTVRFCGNAKSPASKVPAETLAAEWPGSAAETNCTSDVVTARKAHATKTIDRADARTGFAPGPDFLPNTEAFVCLPPLI
jgi:hypothetical protein